MAALAVLFISPCGAQAAAVITVDSATVAPGASGAFDVTVSNTGLDPVGFSSFNWELSVNSTSIWLNSANETTAAQYVFFGDSFAAASLGDPVISHGTANPGPGQMLDGADASNSGGNVTVAAGASVGIGHVVFSLLDTISPGQYTLTLATLTSISDASGSAMTYVPVDGTLNVAAVTGVPEPGTLTLEMLLPPLFAAVRRRMRS